MKITRVRTAVALAVLVGVVVAQPVLASKGWTEDMDKAMAQAAKEGKDLLLDFTGSDWCGWCIKLDKEVFTKEPFASGAPKKFVLVKLDFPRRKKLSAELKKQNETWRDKLGVRGYPTIYLTDAKGRPYGKTGYRAGGPEAYMKHLGELQKARITRDTFLAQADKATGVARAKLIDKAFSGLDMATVLTFYGDLVDEIVTLDATDEAGLKSKYAAQRAMGKVKATVDAALAKRDMAAALAAVDAAIKDLKPTGKVKQDLYFTKSMVHYRNKEKALAKAALLTAKAAAPDTETAGRIDQILSRFFKDEK